MSSYYLPSNPNGSVGPQKSILAPGPPIAHLCKIVSYRICHRRVYVSAADTWHGSRMDASETKGSFEPLHIQYMWNVLIPTELQAPGEITGRRSV